MIFWLIRELLWAYEIILLARMILSWIPVFAPRWRARGILRSLITLIYNVTDPPIRAFNRFIPPLRFGNVGFDMGFLIIFFAIEVVRGLLAGF